MKAIKINPLDNVAVAIVDLPAGEVISPDGQEIRLAAPVTAGHKIALSGIGLGSPVIKYGYPIGTASRDIACGETVHTHNLKTQLEGILSYAYEPRLTPAAPRTPGSFQGYLRPDGRAGIRNEIWIIPTVGCVNAVVQSIERQAQPLVRGTIDGIHAFPHPYGCSQLGQDHENTKKALCGLINHPNAGGVLVVGLGCENNTVEGMKEMLGDYDPQRVRFLLCQETGDELTAALPLIGELAAYASGFSRQRLPMSHLVVGLKCGGSDGFSGITANPLAGTFSDRLIAEGGATILTEVPEMFGAETILMNRCESQEIFRKTVGLINNFKEYYIKNGQNVYENPSPGNKAGGITTLEDKSLGCIQKGGTANVADVLEYGQPVTVNGLNLLNGPGNDLVSASAMTASGAHLVLFTTGRGTPFAAPVPTVKISTHTALYERKPNWIDFDAGRLLSGVSMETMRDQLYDYVRALASGEIKTANEQNGIREFTIFKTGVTL